MNCPGGDRGVDHDDWRCCALVAVLALSAASCLPDPHRSQMLDLLGQLSAACGMLADEPPQVDQACKTVGVVQTRLYGEPGLADIRPAWPELRDAATALSAVCGQDALLAQPSTHSPAADSAQQRWRQGVQREMGVACDHLRAAAAALNRDVAC